MPRFFTALPSLCDGRTMARRAIWPLRSPGQTATRARRPRPAMATAAV